MVLEGPIRSNKFIYSQWFQFKDPIESLKTDDEDDDYYESLSCSILYSDDIQEKGVTIENSVLMGYKGEEEIRKATGKFD